MELILLFILIGFMSRMFEPIESKKREEIRKEMTEFHAYDVLL